MSDTARDPLAKKSTSGDVVSGGPLVALARVREAVKKDGQSAVINIWVDPEEYAPGTKAQTMYK